ncbi:Uncharacterised protein [Mycobacteroides abscessus subsp. abscessus]|nr:Uncharacterised protein [Mycobacteroides abscessus subsp. abscessus]
MALGLSPSTESWPTQRPATNSHTCLARASPGIWACSLAFGLGAPWLNSCRFHDAAHADRSAEIESPETVAVGASSSR